MAGAEQLTSVAAGTDMFGLAALGTIGLVILIAIAIWSIVWKGLALWKSARKSHMIWFIVMLVLNTVGILEILYIFIFSKLGESKAKKRR